MEVQAAGDVASAAGSGIPNHTSGANERNLIVNGIPAYPADYPFFVWTAEDEYDFTADNVCGASLIHPDIIVSAAHCQGYFNYGVRLYDPETRNYDRRLKVVEQHRHPRFNENNENLNYDIMVLKLEKPVFDIPLAKLNRASDFPFPSNSLTAIGYGKLGVDDRFARTLRLATFEVLPGDECESRLRRVHGTEFGEDLLCADSKGGGQSICSGDSGGPLLANGDMLVGISSFTISCQADEVPDGFTRISAFVEWLEGKICEVSDLDPWFECSPSEPANEDWIDLQLAFRYDFSPEDTTFAVRHRETREIMYTGPTYVVPSREVDNLWISRFSLPAGPYIFEVYDNGNDGLDDTRQSSRQGFWRLLATYQDGTPNYSLIAQGDHNFFRIAISIFDLLEPDPSVRNSDGAFIDDNIEAILGFGETQAPSKFAPSK